MQLAVLGMGRMGQALAGRLIKGGHELSIWNRSPGKAPELVERGVTEARSVADALDSAELVLAPTAGQEGSPTTSCASSWVAQGWRRGLGTVTRAS